MKKIIIFIFTITVLVNLTVPTISANTTGNVDSSSNNTVSYSNAYNNNNANSANFDNYLPNNIEQNPLSDIQPLGQIIPYAYLKTTFTQGAALKKAINQMGTAFGAMDVVNFFGAWVPAIGVVCTFGGYFMGKAASGLHQSYQSAYDQGKGIQVIVRLNPSYNGYNAKTLVDVIATKTPLK